MSSAEALAATLNLRRTLGAAVQIMVDRFGSWAGITVLDGGLLRRIDNAGRDDFSGDGKARRFSGLTDTARVALLDATTYQSTHKAPLAPEVREALAVPDDLDVEVVVTVPLVAATSGGAMLVVGTAEAPPLNELGDFARRVARAMSVAAVFEERAHLAQTLRQSLLPAPLPAIPGLQLGAAYRPAEEAVQIGGDFYDVTARPDGRWTFSIGDVCGKGVDAAVLTGQVRQSLRTAALVSDDPAHTLDLVNRTLLGAGGSTFVTVAFGLFAERPGGGIEATMALGGHPPGLLLSDGTVTQVGAGGTLVGMLDTATFHTVAFTLLPGDTLVLYTDGATEARGPDGLLGVEPLIAELADCAGLTAATIAERLMQLVMEHLVGWPHDDVAFLVLRGAG